jgi:cytochrome c oxidase accessory protein FixG
VDEQLTLIEPPERVLSTLNKDGTRRWLRPKVAMGRWWQRRRIVAWTLMLLFTLIPWIEIGGRPLMRFDLVTRNFSFFGIAFRPTDSLLLMLLLLAIFLGIFLTTALVGRAWCGWACPQTVYLEYLFRPIERAIKNKVLRWAAFTVLALHLANTFLSYFAGPRAVLSWSFGSPADHPAAFALVLGTTALILFDFGWFREQMCTIVCPYARLQSGLLDRDSLIIGYDVKRGEPRGHLKTGKEAGAGDCIDCKLCVAACPTGIDIRDGLQLECVACVQCVDACDAVMDKIHKPRGLIRYASQNALAGAGRKFWRPRTLIYPGIILLCLTGLVIGLTGRDTALVRLLRVQNVPFMAQADGTVLNPVRISIENRDAEARAYTLELLEPEGARLLAPMFPLTIPAGEERTVILQAIIPGGAFDDGRVEARFRISDGANYEKILEETLPGPLTHGKEDDDE